MAIHLTSQKILKDWTDYNNHMNVAYYVLIFDIYGAEKLMTSLLENSEKLASPKEIVVKDMSGGCGAMYNIYVASPSFKNLNMIKQHRLVQGILKEEIKEMHGLTIETKVMQITKMYKIES